MTQKRQDFWDKMRNVTDALPIACLFCFTTADGHHAREIQEHMHPRYSVVFSYTLSRSEDRLVFFATPRRSVTHDRRVSPPACACSCSADRSSRVSIPVRRHSPPETRQELAQTRLH